MAYQIIWTAEADADFHSIIIYLKEHWSGSSTEKFADKTMSKLEKLADVPYVIPRFTSNQMFRW
ncbi:MAG: type II toxin-antitoxin system RelE/ParE family toxin [Ferruginibacter sp.]